MSRKESARRNPVVAAVAVIGIVVTIVATLGIRDRNHRHAAEWLETRADLVDTEIRRTLDDTISDLSSFAGFLEARPETTQAEMATFGERIQVSQGVVATAFVRVVPAAELDDFVAEMRRSIPSYRITELDPAAGMVTAADRDTFYPIQYLLPGPFLTQYAEAQPDFSMESTLGFDAASGGGWSSGLQRVLERSDLVVSDFFSLGELNIGKAFVVLDPMYRDGEIIGIVGAVALDVLLTPYLGGLSEEIEWEIDSSGPTAPESGHYWSKDIDIAGTTWMLTVRPTEEAAVSLAGTPTWLVAIAGILATLVLSVLAHGLTQRSRDRRRIASLQQAAEDKDRFLAAVSHEIRTPLTVVAGFAHELRDRGDQLESEERAVLLGEVAQQSDEMTAIIEDLLVAARTDIRNVKIHQQSIDLRSHVLEVIPPIEDLEIAVSDDTASAFADPRRVRQIVRNLVTNANRYGGPHIAVSFEASRTTAALIITDDGEPIPRDRRDAIFDPYTSAHKAVADVGSIGLGLFISRELAQLMGGDLEYDHDGSHSRFRLTLPAGVDNGRPTPVPPPVPVGRREAGRSSSGMRRTTR